MSTREVRDVERIDVTDQLFHRRTGMLAPGKSYPLACNGSHASNEERRQAWSEWFASGQAFRDHQDRIVRLEEDLARMEEEAADDEAKGPDPR